MTEPALGIWFLPLDVPRDYTTLADAILWFIEDSGLVLDKVSLHTRRRGAARVLRAKTVRDGVNDPSVYFVSLLSEQDRSWIGCYLRPFDPLKQETQPREGCIVSPQLPPAVTPAMLTFLDAIARVYPLAQAGIAGYRSLSRAGVSCSCGAFSISDVDAVMQRVKKYDGLHNDLCTTRLQRLYPVTIIGPKIWAQLPPMPKVDPPPIVEDLGDCKILTAWPELVEPHDPAFLAGTVELRRWLWPYTIQNPADVVGLESPTFRPVRWDHDCRICENLFGLGRGE